MMRRTNPAALTQYLSLNQVYVGILQPKRGENGITIIVGLDAQNHVSTIQIQQVVRERANRADH